MQAILLAAGKSSRFYPFSNPHKTMVYLLGKPILAYTVEGLIRSGIKEIIMIVRGDGEVEKYFGDGKKLGISIVYVVQKDALGMGDALMLAKKYLRREFVLLGGHHVNSQVLLDELVGKKNKGVGVLLLKKRPNFWNYGVAKMEGGRVVGIVEKPKKGTEPSDYTLVSFYYLPKSFLSLLANTEKHHYNFEDALDEFAKTQNVAAVITKQEITTLRYPWDLLLVKNYLLARVKKSIGKKAKIAKSAEIIGEVVVKDGARIMEGARVKGPCYIGKNVVIGDNALLRGGVDVEEESVVGSYMEVKNSLVMRGFKSHSGFIGDSVIGQNCKIGAQFSTANVRLDRNSVQVQIGERKEDTGLKSLGAFIGSGVTIGIKASTMPGVIIGNNAIIGPSTIVMKNVSDNMKYATKFQEIVEEKQ